MEAVKSWFTDQDDSPSVGIEMWNIDKQRVILVAACAAMTVLQGGCTGQQSSGNQKSGTPVPAVYGNLEQVMVGIMFPAANIVGVAMERDPLKIPLADDPVTTTDPMGSLYGGWRAVENAGIAIAEATSLMDAPGRKCTSGRDVPTKSPEWTELVDQLRKESLAVYEAAKAKNQEKLREAGAAIDTTCDKCHAKYLERTANVEDRCKP
jgi:hypothetical protein